MVVRLLLLWDKSRLLRGALADLAREFGTSERTAARLWQRVRKALAVGTGVDFLDKIKENSGRKSLLTAEKRDESRAKVVRVPLCECSTLRTLADRLSVPRSTLSRYVKAGLLRRRTAGLHPLLSRENKKKRVEFSLSSVNSNSNTALEFDPLLDYVHVDEKWFYLKQINRSYYLVLVAVARLRYVAASSSLFDGKIGVWPVIDYVLAARNSKNRPAGTIEMKEATMNRGKHRTMMVEDVLPAIKAVWPGAQRVVIQHDNATPHILPDDAAFVEVASSDGWDITIRPQPPNSPDLNVLDLGFFTAIQALQMQKAARNVHDLVRNVNDAFSQMSAFTLDRVFMSLQTVVHSTLKHDGGNDFKIKHHNKGALQRCSDDKGTLLPAISPPDILKLFLNIKMERIELTNVRDGDVLAHPLVLLEGFVRDVSSLPLPPEDFFLDVRLDAARGCFWPVTAHAGKFKAFVLLPEPGKYAITLRVGGPPHLQQHHPVHALPQRLFFIEYVPVVTRYVVRFYYQKCADAAAEGFDAPPGADNSDQAAIDKIRFNALLMQTMTSEMFHDAGLPRKTFAMECAADGLPLVRMLRSRFTNATARSIHDQELIRLVHEDIDAYGFDTHDELEFKHAVILGCSKYNPVTQKPEGHTALGGERVGVFGSCGLHTWPRHFGELTACCLNNNKVDARMLMDDSCYRGTFWANYSTGIGAFLHELGHTFGLGHSNTGIMGRGFDDMNHLLCAYEIDPHCGKPGFYQQFGDGRLQLNLAAVREVSERHGAHWNSGSARILQHCPWISAMPRQSKRVPTVSWAHDICGPVGMGQYDGQQIAFDTTCTTTTTRQANSYDDLGAVLIDFGSFLNRIQTFTRSEVVNWGGSKCSNAGKHLFVLLDGEYITQVDVRAMAYIDGIQIHTNKRTSRWYGGFGGVLEVLKPADGCRIHGFFGTLGDNYVGTLGAFCSQVISSIHGSTTTTSSHHQQPLQSASITSSPTVAGMALSDGVQHPFTAQCASALPAAIAIKCDEQFVKSVRVLSSEELVMSISEQENPAFGPHEHVFQLVAGEKLVRIEAKSGHWVDAIRFVTNLRTSPWFGGVGGTETIVIGAPGYQICGFYGTHGDRFVGSIGALYCPDQTSSSADSGYSKNQQSHANQATVAKSALESFSLMNISSSPLPGNLASAHSSLPPLGILVATQHNQVTFVQSFDSFQAFDEIVNRLYGLTQFDGMEVTCFPLTLEEQLLQVDVSYHALPSAVSFGTGQPSTIAIVNGICFHTTTRCSSWIGAFNGDNLRFFVAPRGSAIHDLAGVFTNSTLTDIVGRHVSTDFTRAQFQQLELQHRPYFSPDGRARLDSGGFNVRIEARSSFGIESVHLLKKNNGDHLNCHAWDWTKCQAHLSQSKHPHRWFVPQRMLTDKVKDNSTELLFKEYIVGALDCGGGFSKAAGPPQ